jgi:hypothetical protein
MNAAGTSRLSTKILQRRAKEQCCLQMGHQQIVSLLVAFLGGSK